MKTEDNLLAWRAVVEVARSGSFRDAAIRLDTDVSAVSRLVTALEKRLGNTFFDRSSRPVRLSAFGEKHLEEIRHFVQEEADLLQSLTQSDANERQKIRFGIVSGYPRNLLLTLIAEYSREHPGVDIEVLAEMDHLDVLRGRVDLAYLLYRPEDERLASRFVHKLGVLPVASRRYVEEHGFPEEPEDLLRHTLLARTSRNYPQSTCLMKGMARRPLMAAHVISGDYLTIKSALFASLGIAVDLPTFSLKDGLQSGEIVPVLPGWMREPFEVSLVYRRCETIDPLLDNFLGWFIERERRAALERFEAVGLPFEAKRHFISWC